MNLNSRTFNLLVRLLKKLPRKRSIGFSVLKFYKKWKLHFLIFKRLLSLIEQIHTMLGELDEPN